ncbi:MAG: carbon-nitrogen family hydrolase [Planctomycetota bacterium]|nr:carbon-nitrogen family hydrolase [Planctomycetota bacterium]
MNVACVQLNTAWESKPANHAKVETLLAVAEVPAGSLVLLPEMFATGFSMNVAALTDSYTHETERFLARLASRFGVHVLGGLVTTGADAKGRNEAVAVGPDGRELARYCKLHPFSYAGENSRYTPGSNVVTFPWREFTVAPFICYDLRFPEVFRHAVKRGAQLFAVLANWPAPREEHWVALLKARAIETQAFGAGVNRCGRDPAHSYSGRSMVVDPRGVVLADAGDRETVISADVDLNSLLAYRREFPALDDMRGDLP